MDFSGLIEHARRHSEIIAVYLFGSRSRGEQRESSDMDIAVLFYEPVDFRFELRLGVEIERLMGSGKVDVVNLNRQKLAFQHRVLREGKILYCSDELTEQRFRERVIREFCDFEPLLRRYYRDLEHSLREEFFPYAGSSKNQ